ncbi:hypothetical protein MPER_05412, partial [Moniliophthora perniciosa FA553]
LCCRRRAGLAFKAPFNTSVASPSPFAASRKALFSFLWKQGFSGKASLFTEMNNVRLSPPKVRLMATGAHTMQEINCAKCAGYLGWKINRAHERSETWKEGNYLLELENLYATRLEAAIPRSPPLPHDEPTHWEVRKALYSSMYF